MARQIELWKPVIGFEKCYEVSSFGQVRSYHRPRNIATKETGPFIKTQTVDKDGYKRVSLYGKSKGKRIMRVRSVHRIMLETFIGPCPEGCESSHIDGDSTNNIIDNLCWETHAENNRRRAEHGTLPKGESHPHFGKTLSKETRRKMSEANKGKHIGKNNSFFGKKHSEESKKKMSDSHKRNRKKSKNKRSCSCLPS